jgi:hypothetical protein
MISWPSDLPIFALRLIENRWFLVAPGRNRCKPQFVEQQLIAGPGSAIAGPGNAPAGGEKGEIDDPPFSSNLLFFPIPVSRKSKGRSLKTYI